jgi:hypothetical protein
MWLDIATKPLGISVHYSMKEEFNHLAVSQMCLVLL